MKSISAQLTEARDEAAALRKGMDAILNAGDAMCETAIRGLAGETNRDGATQAVRAFRKSLRNARKMHLSNFAPKGGTAS